MVELDQETRDKIIETHTDIKYILQELEEGRDQFDKHESRIRRIETLFLPILVVLSIFGNKVMTWVKP